MNREEQGVVPEDAYSDVNCVHQASRTLWSEEELARLRHFTKGRVDADKLAEAFPHRTLRAVQVRLCDLRREHGCQIAADGPQPLDPDDQGFEDGKATEWSIAAKRSNRAFLAALAKMQARQAAAHG